MNYSGVLYLDGDGGPEHESIVFAIGHSEDDVQAQLHAILLEVTKPLKTGEDFENMSDEDWIELCFSESWRLIIGDVKQKTWDETPFALRVKGDHELADMLIVGYAESYKFLDHKDFMQMAREALHAMSPEEIEEQIESYKED